MENKKEKAKIELELLMRINSLRKYISDNVSTKDEIVPDDEDLSKSDLDDLFDIDIFFSRKPGMRRSVQLIMSDATDLRCFKISVLTMLASLCDTLVSKEHHNSFDMDEEDILLFMSSWLESHNINPMALVSDKDLKEYKTQKRKNYLKELRNTDRYKELRKDWDKKYQDKQKESRKHK